MTLVIEDTQNAVRTGCRQFPWPTTEKQNGDLMRDPEMIFEAEESRKQNESGALLLAE